MEVESKPVTQVFLCDVLRATQEKLYSPRIARYGAGRTELYSKHQTKDKYI